jgi:hypothetical protein
LNKKQFGELKNNLQAGVKKQHDEEKKKEYTPYTEMKQ